MPQQFSNSLLKWFHHHGRSNLPWQENQTPYRVWVSEIMLQQTQVNTVIPYYQKFMNSFPSVDKLAKANEDLVLHHWTGLGYYARARNLHKAAQIIHQKFQSNLPNTVEELCELPGIGKSTAGAIISLAKNQKAVILDGNVKRVLCRYHCIEGWPDQTDTLKQLWKIAEEYTPTINCNQYTQAIMDLGATLCTRSKPACPICPLNSNCLAYKENKTAEFPHKKPRKALPVKSIYMLIYYIKEEAKVLLEKRPPQGIWGGLWSFPETDCIEEFKDTLNNQIMTDASPHQLWKPIRHTFSHFHLDITPVVMTLKKANVSIMENDRWHWYDLQNPAELGLAAPVKKLLSKIT
jgi:A/G-specific adenine glycosylase